MPLAVVTIQRGLQEGFTRGFHTEGSIRRVSHRGFHTEGWFHTEGSISQEDFTRGFHKRVGFHTEGSTQRLFQI